MQAALKELKKTEKRAYDSWAYIGIYKRYMTIGEAAAAEKLLKKALKKNGTNQELLAVYTNFLLRADRQEEAVPHNRRAAGIQLRNIEEISTDPQIR
jgi:Tfp pilus assembly protein PilF